MGLPLLCNITARVTRVQSGLNPQSCVLVSGYNFQLVSIKFPLVSGPESQLKDSYVPPEYPVG